MRYSIIVGLILVWSCTPSERNQNTENPTGIELLVLGTVQDGGSPHIGCEKECCTHLFETPDRNRMVVSLGLVNHNEKTTYLFEASPDISRQLKKLSRSGTNLPEYPNGIFLTHAHIGHYTGLMYLGKEASDAGSIPVYAMPRMRKFLNRNDPWKSLIINKNIELLPLVNDSNINLSNDLSVRPLIVPHRDELSETVGFVITGPNASALFIPDIDKWSKWHRSIKQEVRNVDYALIDATFYDGEEINHRDISQIPHPFVVETMEIFKDWDEAEKKKVYFIHFNHTNPLLNKGSQPFDAVTRSPFNIAETGMRLTL